MVHLDEKLRKIVRKWFRTTKPNPPRNVSPSIWDLTQNGAQTSEMLVSNDEKLQRNVQKTRQTIERNRLSVYFPSKRESSLTDKSVLTLIWNVFIGMLLHLSVWEVSKKKRQQTCKKYRNHRSTLHTRPQHVRNDGWLPDDAPTPHVRTFVLSTGPQWW